MESQDQKSDMLKRKAMAVLRKSNVFGAATEQELNGLTAGAGVKCFSPGSVIFTPSDSTDLVYVLLCGKVILYRLTSNGKRVMIWQITSSTANKAFGCEGLESFRLHHNFAETSEYSEICIIKLNDFKRLIEHRPEMMWALLKDFGKYILYLHERFIEKYSGNILARLAYFILSNTDPSSGMLEGFSHEDIGEIVGGLRQTVTENLSFLRKQQMILTKSKKIIVLDRPGLERIAGGSYLDRLAGDNGARYLISLPTYLTSQHPSVSN